MNHVTDQEIIALIVKHSKGQDLADTLKEAIALATERSYRDAARVCREITEDVLDRYDDSCDACAHTIESRLTETPK